jgi:peptidoglycan/LPS O-acetylase OafA/YrhL
VLAWLRRLDRLGLVLLVWVAAGMLAQQALPAVAPGLARTIAPHLERIGITEWVHCFGLGYVVLRFSRHDRLGPVELGLVVLGLLRQYQVSLHWSVILLAAFALILYLAVTGRMRFLANAPLLYLGALSYPLYLVHSNLGYVIIRGLEANRFSADLAIGVATVVAFALAAVIHHLVEDPVRSVLLGHAPGGPLGPVRTYGDALRAGLVAPLTLPRQEKE